MGTGIATGCIREQNNKPSLVIVVISCCEEDELDKEMPCKLSDNDLVVVTMADEQKHTEMMKRWTECLVDIN